MLNKLRLFVKENMEAVLAGIGSLFIGLAFASLVHASDKDTQWPDLFLWLSLVGLVAGIGFYIWCFIKGAEKEKQERDRHNKEMQAWERFIEINTPEVSGTYLVSKPDEPKGDKDAKT